MNGPADVPAPLDLAALLGIPDGGQVAVIGTCGPVLQHLVEGRETVSAAGARSLTGDAGGWSAVVLGNPVGRYEEDAALAAAALAPDGILVLTSATARRSDLRRLQTAGYDVQVLGLDSADAPQVAATLDASGAARFLVRRLRQPLTTAQVLRRVVELAWAATPWRLSQFPVVLGVVRRA